MISQLRDRWLWAFAYELVQNHGFERIENALSRDQVLFKSPTDDILDQVWLIRNQGRTYDLIRLQAIDGVWPSVMARDLRAVNDKVPLFRKQLRAKELRFHNVYVFTDPYDQAISDYFDALGDVEDHKSQVNHQGVVVKEGLQPLQLKVDHLDLQQLDIDQANVEARTEYITQTLATDEIKRAIKEEDQKKEETFKQTFQYGKPYLTFTLIALHVLIFLYMESVGSTTDTQTLIDFGAKWNPAIVDGEWWRLITPMFIHIGLMHLIFNNLALFFLGSAVERIYGTRRFLFMYFFAGLTGTMASFAFVPNVSAGASGAIFGCFGALLYFGLKHPNLFFRTMGMDVIFILVLNLGMGFAIPMIDNYGHIGGLVGGFLAAAMMNLPRKKIARDRLAAFAVALIAVPVVLWAGYQQLFVTDTPLANLVEAELALQENDLDTARDRLEQVLDEGYDEPEVYLQLGAVYAHGGEYEQAEEMLLEAQERGADQAQLYFQLSYVQLQQERYEEGRENLERAIEEDPDLMEAYYNLALVYLEEGQEEAAVNILEEAIERDIADETIEDLLEQMITD